MLVRVNRLARDSNNEGNNGPNKYITYVHSISYGMKELLTQHMMYPSLGFTLYTQHTTKEGNLKD